MVKLEDAIANARKTLVAYERVHEELSGGKKWDEIDRGWRADAPPCSYNFWLAYMDQRLIIQLRQIILSHNGGKDYRNQDEK